MPATAPADSSDSGEPGSDGIPGGMSTMKDDTDTVLLPLGGHAPDSIDTGNQADCAQLERPRKSRMANSEPRKFRCATQPANSDLIHAACVGGEQKRFSRWKPGCTVRFTVVEASFPSRKWARFARHALVKAAEDWNAKEVGVRFQPVRQSERAVFALKYYRAPSEYLADAFAPDSKNRTLYIFNTSLHREYWPHLTNLFRHELGHVLGLRHDDAATREWEIPSVELAPANELSIMNFYPEIERFGACSIQESDVMAVRKLCSLSESTFDGFQVITVDPDTLEPWNFEGSDRLSSIDSALVSSRDSDSDSAHGPENVDPSRPSSAGSVEFEGAVLQASAQSDSAGRGCCEDATSSHDQSEVDVATTGHSNGSEATPTTPAAPSIHISPPASENPPTLDDATVSKRNAANGVPNTPGELARSGFLAVPTADSLHLESEKGDWSDECVKEGHHEPEVLDLDIQDALTPDPGTEALFLVPDNPFAFSPGQLSKMFNPKSFSAFYALGGLAGLERGLRTDRDSGLSIYETNLEGYISFTDAATYGASMYGALGEKAPKARSGSKESGYPPITSNSSQSGSFLDRIRVFKTNHHPNTEAKRLHEFAWTIYSSRIRLVLLTVTSAVSFAWGVGQDREATKWAEGIAILGCLTVMIAAETNNQWVNQPRLARIKRLSEDTFVDVVRSGKWVKIPEGDLLVGDVASISTETIVPADGVLIEGHGLKCDESSCTGESDLIPKISADEAFILLDDLSNGAVMRTGALHGVDPFIISGAKVVEGSGTFLVTAVGINSLYGQVRMAVRDMELEEPTPREQKLGKLCSFMARSSAAVSLLLFTVVFIKFLLALPHTPVGPVEKGQTFLRVLILSITVNAVASLPFLSDLGSTIIANTSNKMLLHNSLVRGSKACETAALITTICTEKTGLLTQSKMRVDSTAKYVEGTMFFGDPNPSLTNDDQLDTHSITHDTPAREFIQSCSNNVKTLLTQSIMVNSTAFEKKFEEYEPYICSNVEVALMNFCRNHLPTGSASEERANAIPLRQVFYSAAEPTSTLIRLPSGGFRLYVKGPAQVILEQCANVVADATSESLSTYKLEDTRRQLLQERISSYSSLGIRSVALSYRDSARPSRQEDLTLLAIFLVVDPLRPGMRQAITECQRAGILLRMVTDDNIDVARAVAAECGLYSPEYGQIALEGPMFRRMSEYEQKEVAPRLSVLARASPEDKRILIRALRELGETVAVTGGGINDAPSLKMASVGFARGVTGTEIAKKASDIVLKDENIRSVLWAVKLGRAGIDGLRKFVQFKLTAMITAIVLTFLSAAVSAFNETPVLNAVQFIWVGLLTDATVAALALDIPLEITMERMPDRRSSPIITSHMRKMMSGQVICQLVVVLVLYFGWQTFPGNHEIPTPGEGNINARRNTVVFNVFVWLQLFNALNSRRLDNRFNIFERIMRNPLSLVVGFLVVGGQVLIIFMGGKAFGVVPLSARDWGLSIGIGALSLPLGVLLRLMPTPWVDEAYYYLFQALDSILWAPREVGRLLRRRSREQDEEEGGEWDPTL
ncbi:hypothetical protein B0T14DRAFT_481701 [Immersiella caudata]|uniref:Calcium-transporting ATPase n=1 Tax=Immersiella caudata TaxID=314043 RepID=A0AA39WSC2_9PEZI|nr:hypothetical protein B0T14DRAFT_481701 [Immersiella caudata]